MPIGVQVQVLPRAPRFNERVQKMNLAAFSRQILSRAPEKSLLGFFFCQKRSSCGRYLRRRARTSILYQCLNAKLLTYYIISCCNVNISRRRDAPNGEIPKANLLFWLSNYFFFNSISIFLVPQSAPHNPCRHSLLYQTMPRQFVL